MIPSHVVREPEWESALSSKLKSLSPNYDEEKGAFGRKVRVAQYPAVGKKLRGAVIYLPEAGQSFKDHEELFMLWREQGLLVWTFDYPNLGIGATAFATVHGRDYRRMITKQFQHFKTLKLENDVSIPVYLVGSGLGGLILAKMMTREAPEQNVFSDAGGVILDNPRLSPRWRERGSSISRSEAENFPTSVPLLVRLGGRSVNTSTLGALALGIGLLDPAESSRDRVLPKLVHVYDSEGEPMRKLSEGLADPHSDTFEAIEKAAELIGTRENRLLLFCPDYLAGVDSPRAASDALSSAGFGTGSITHVAPVQSKALKSLYASFISDRVLFESPARNPEFWTNTQAALGHMPQACVRLY
jgi:hypothetical protein